ncbi:hypothetical protein MMC21_000905 [Puttea exsequens]|nr:hypothetical protein [Puttea exsequens]
MAASVAPLWFLLLAAFCVADVPFETFDPATANPEGNITCIGDSYPLLLPVVGNFNPNQVTMQQLCAKPQYNGGQRGQHIGGWCATPPSHGFPGIVSFDSSTEAQVNKVLANKRVMAGCMYKCFCNHGLEDPSIQPLNSFAGARMHSFPSVLTYELELDIVDDFGNPPLPKHGSLETGVKTLIITSRWESYGAMVQLRNLISLAPENHVSCRGDLPAFGLPPPFTVPSDHFVELQEMCANQFSGGSQ